MIQPSTIAFLKRLKKHNERSWFSEHKDAYLAAKTNFEDFIQQLLVGFGKLDPGISNLTVKECVFRIYRDIRFSKDKTPYKAHFAAGMNKGGKRVHFPGYYLHIEPGNTYLGGGIWHPSKEMLHKVRQEIDYNFDDFLSIISKKTFKDTFGSFSEEDKLMRPPRGYEKDNPAIEYLKLRSFTVGTSFSDKAVMQPDFIKKVLDTYKKVKPLIDFIEIALDG